VRATRNAIQAAGAAGVNAARRAGPPGVPGPGVGRAPGFLPRARLACIMRHMSDSPPESLPLWLAGPAPAFAPLSAPFETEVAIVGGGITGITLAYTLADQGALVTLLEARDLAGEASGRNAGFMLAAPAEPYSERIAIWGREGARAVLQIGRRTHQRIRQLVQGLGIECEYQQTGSLRLTRTPEESEDLRGSLPELKHDGFPMREIPVADAVPAHAVGAFDTAFEVPEDGQLNPVKFLYGLSVEAAKKGAHIHPRSAVDGAHWNNGTWEITCNGHVVRARTLVLATNAFTPQLLPHLGAIIAPRRGQMLATEPLEETIASRPTYAHWGQHYWRQTPDGRLLIGGWRELDFDAECTFGNEVTPTIQQAIESGLQALLPRPVKIDYRWSGIMGYSRDGRPLVGWLDAAHHLAICGGFTGHGLGLATACTQDLAELLAWKRATGISTFDPQRFPELRQVREGIVALGAAANG
jgi:glycine/D-amino acid oxidase-like deaminating enzyme